MAVTNSDVVVDEGVAEAAYRRIRGDIVSCVLKPRQKLRLEPLKVQYGVGIGTLREILNRLASEDLVVAEGQRGFEVSPATATNLREVAALRLLLEGHALKLSLAAGDLEWEGRVVAAHHKLAVIERQLLDGAAERTAEWVRYDFNFHNALISACGSKALLDLHASVFDRFLRYHMLAVSFRGPAVATDHRALFDLALKRDIGGAQAMLAGHVNSGVAHVLATVKI